MTTKNITVEMRGDARGVTRAARTAVGAMRGVGRAAKRAATSVGGIATGLAGLAAGAGLVTIGVQAAESVDKVAKLGTQLGITNTEVQKLQLQAELSGLSQEKLVKGFQQVTRVSGDAQRGLKSAVEAFEQIGLSVEDLAGKDPATLFQMVIDGLAGIEDPAKRASAGAILLGGAYRQMVPLIEDGGASAARAAAIFDELDLGIGDLAGNVEHLNDNWAVMKTIGTALRDQVFATLAPELDKLLAITGQVVEEWIKLNGGGQAVAKMLAGEMVEGFKSVIDWMGQAADVANGFLEVLDLMVQGLRFLGQLGGAVGAAAVAVSEGNFSEAGTILNTDLADVWDAANPEEDAGQELSDQTSLLRDILRAIENSNGAAFG